MPILKGKFFFHQIRWEKSAAYYIRARSIVGQIRYLSNSDKMHQCVTVIHIQWKFHRILHICHLVTTEFDNFKLNQGQ